MEKNSKVTTSQVRSERCLVRMVVQVTTEDSHAPVFSKAFSSNLSNTGMYLKGCLDANVDIDSIVPGFRISLRFSLPRTDLTFNLIAEVVWVNSRERDVFGASALGLGLRYMKIPDGFEKEIQRFIRDYRYQVLIVDDDVSNLELVKRTLNHDYLVVAAQNSTNALTHIEKEEFAVIILDQYMPGMTGLDLLNELNRCYPGLATVKIVLSAYADPDVVREYINRGKIFHYFEKPVDITELKQVVDSAVEHYTLIVENERLNSELIKSNERLLNDNIILRAKAHRIQEFESIVGKSAAIMDVLHRLEQIAEYPASVHISGETGTGKELVARAIHRSSPRKDRNFVAYNCAGIPDPLVQSTLFGYQKGAFTGADQNRKGVFEEADGGTVLLDEIGDISPAVQTSLLRVLQEGEVVRVGSTQSRKIDVRIISATHHDLRAEAQAGHFRHDLFYRLMVVEITLPSLRERIEDIPLLAEHFLKLTCNKFSKKITGLTPKCVSLLRSYEWPGNVRELENEIKRAVIYARGTRLDADDLSPTIKAADGSVQFLERYSGMSLPEVLQDTESRLIRDAVLRCDNVVARAAELLGIQVSTLHKKIKRLGL